MLCAAQQWSFSNCSEEEAFMNNVCAASDGLLHVHAGMFPSVVMSLWGSSMQSLSCESTHHQQLDR